MVKHSQRKYLSEFGIRSFSEKVTICYPNDLANTKKQFPNDKYHIYMINKIDRFKFKNFKIDESNNLILIEIEKGILKKESIFINPIDLKPIFDEWNCDYKTLKIYMSEDKKTLFFTESIENSVLGLGVLSLLANDNVSERNIPLEILYIGQSYGNSGDRDAFDRLISHSTLQKIANELYSNPENIDYELAITLWEFTPFLDHVIDGREKNFLVPDIEDEQHFLKVMNSNIKYGMNSDVINVTEAALINYFKPKYNYMYKNNFPSVSHKGYKQYYNLDFNAILVELDPTCINVEIYSSIKKYNIFETITYNLESEENRKSMFEL